MGHGWEADVLHFRLMSRGGSGTTVGNRIETEQGTENCDQKTFNVCSKYWSAKHKFQVNKYAESRAYWVFFCKIYVYVNRVR
jgi:hypothetical protein